MSHVRSKNTKPELVVRSVLHRMGYRFSLRGNDLPGRPDIVLPKYRTVVFVHGCFWHRHPNCGRASAPATNVDYWQEKFRRNVERDEVVVRTLEELGWTVVIVWECEVEKRLDEIADKLHTILGGKQVSYRLPATRELFRAAERRADYRTTR